MLTPSSPCEGGDFGSLRTATSIVPHSTTSKSMSMPTALKFCCMNSFIGMGTICPDPDVEIMIFAFTGLSGPYPAAFSSAFAFSGSYLYRLTAACRTTDHPADTGPPPVCGAIQHRAHPFAVDRVVQRLAHPLILERGTIGAVQCIGIRMWIRPQADLQTCGLQRRNCIRRRHLDPVHLPGPQRGNTRGRLRHRINDHLVEFRNARSCPSTPRCATSRHTVQAPPW